MRPLRFARALPDDDAAIRRLLRDNPMAGAISLSFEREPSYFAGGGLADATDDTIVAFEDDRLVCLGRCTTREGWLGGESRRIAYLGELRLDATATRRGSLLRGGYRFFRETRAPADFTFTSIAADNHRALRLLERGLPGLPAYTLLTEFVTLVIPVPRRSTHTTLRPVPANPAHLEALVALLNTTGRRHSLAPVWTAGRVRALARHGLPLGDFQLFHDGPRLIAAAAVWDQRVFRQTVFRGYEPALAAARPLLNLSARLFGTPRLPPVGSTLAHASLSPLATEDDALLPELVAASLGTARARQLEFLTLGLVASDPRLAPLERRFRPRTYRSRLYQVTWPGDPAVPESFGPTSVRPEVAFL
ncbi:MAG: hypothetical protein NTV51_03035 [Verrucomicrobia bacterium]|nr:hypothetical protein [Verrucomicrobiota bacterium]